jgi:Protein of unknown function (DUF2889)
MPLLPGGEPLHTRSMTLEARAAEGGRLALRGEVLDVRKRGLVPLPGALQLPGVIHRMELEARLDPETRALEALEVRQPVVAFEASEATRGESCRDAAGNLKALVGTPLDETFLRRLSEAYGGPRGCTHVLSLARLLASCAARVLELESALGSPPRPLGERVLRRVLVLDGFERSAEGTMQLAVQLSDVHVRPRPPGPAEGLDLLASQTEIRVLAALDLATTAIRELGAEERRRTRAELASAVFRDRSAELVDFVGRPLMAGVGAALAGRFGGEPRSAPLLDALLALAPGYVQCVAAVSDLFLPGGGAAATVGAGPDSCFMWRRGGALSTARAARDEAPGGRPK